MTIERTERLNPTLKASTVICGSVTIQKFDRLLDRICRTFELGVFGDRENIRLANPLIKRLRKTLKHEGPQGLTRLSKELFQWSFQTYGEATYIVPLYYTRKDSKGRPIVLASVLRRYERSKDPRLFQFLLSLLSIYREYLGSGKPDKKALFVITDSNNDLRSRLDNSSSMRKSYIKASKQYLSKYDTTTDLGQLRGPKLFTTSFGPQSCKGVIPTGEFPTFNPITKQLEHKTTIVRKTSLMVSEAEAVALMRDKDTLKHWLKWCKITDQQDLVVLMKESAEKFKGKDVLLPCNRIGFKPDKGLKNRPYAMVNYWIQLSLGGLHTWAYNLLEKDQSNECFNHRKAFLRCVNSIDNSTLQGCLDERAATDLFPDTPISWVIGSRFGPVVGDSWLLLMRSLSFRVNNYVPIKWGCGQPLGTKGSWPLYNVASEVVDSMPQIRKLGRSIPVTLRVGYDTRYLGKKWIDAIRSWREDQFGSDFGKGKGIQSKSAVEICKQYFIKTGEVTPLSATLCAEAYRDYATFGMLVKRLHESSNVSFSYRGLSLLASSQSFARNTDGKMSIRSTFLDNRLAILAFYQLNRTDYNSVVKLITLTMIERALVEATVSYSFEKGTFAERVGSATRAKAISSLRHRTVNILTDPNPELDWSFIRRLLPSPPKWLTEKVSQQRGLSRVVDFVTISTLDRDALVVKLTDRIYSVTGYP